MASGELIKDKPFDGTQDRLPSSMYGLLALRQHRQNKAVGIRRITPQVELLLVSYQDAKKREFEREYALGFKLGSTVAATKRMKEIMTEAKKATPERRRELLQEAEALQKRLEEITQQ